MKKCGLCRKGIIGNNFNIQILKEERVLYGDSEDYRKRFPTLGTEPEHWEWEAMGGRSLLVCEDCASKRYILKHTKSETFPLILDMNGKSIMNWGEAEKELDRNLWKKAQEQEPITI